jgi:peptide/nickel transport system permease protein
MSTSALEAAIAPRVLVDTGARHRATWLARVPLILGILIVLATIVAAVFAPLFTHYDPTFQDLLNPLEAPGAAGHPLGTDQFGRDTLSRLLYSGRIDLLIAFGATGVTLTTGSLIGLISGYYGGWTDAVIMRIVDIVFAFPFIVLVLTIIAILGPGVFNMFVAIWLVSWIPYARIIRGEVLVAKRQEYVVAARALGYRGPRIMLGHVLPNVITPAIIFSMLDAVGNVGLGAALGYLGLGVQVPTPEWGNMIADSQNFMTTNWWLAALPGAAIVIFGMGMSLVGDGLADWLRPGG